MNRLLFTAVLALLATTLPALDYTVSIRIDPQQHKIDPHNTRCYAQLLVGDTLIKEANIDLPDATGDQPLTLTFEDVHDKLVEALSKDPSAEVRLEYYYRSNNGGLPLTEHFASQTVPSVAYATIADNVEKAVGGFMVSGTLKAKDISVNGKTEITLASTENTITTLTTSELKADTLHVNQTFTTTSATFSGKTTFNAALKGRGTVPVGTILMFASTVNPGEHWQLCDGSPIKEGPFAGSLTPNLEGRFPYATHDFSKVGKTGGAKQVTLTKANIPAHTHQYTLVEPFVTTENMKGATQKETGGDEWRSGGDKTVTSSAAGATTPAPVSLMPPYRAHRFYIRIQ